MKKTIEIKSSELAKVDNNSLNPQQLKFMLAKTPAHYIQSRPAKGGGRWSYVSGTYVKKVLNLMFGWNWDFEVLEYKYDLDIKQCFVLGKLTCRTGGNTIIKTQFGRQDIKFKRGTSIPLDLGNDLKAATTDCLKKCASEIGIAADVYAPKEFREVNVVEDLPELKPTDKTNWDNVKKALLNGYTFAQFETKWKISEQNKKLLENETV